MAPTYRLKAPPSALAFNVRPASPARLPLLPPVLPRCCLLGPAIAVPSPTKYPSTLQMMREPQFATARTARHVHRPLSPFPHAPASVHSIRHSSRQRYRNSPAATLALPPRSPNQPSRSSPAQNTSKYMKQTTGRA
jgi:hypothetical protein